MENVNPRPKSVKKNDSRSLKFKVGECRSVVPPGEYKVRIISIVKKPNFNREILVFLFEIVEGSHKGTQLNGFCNADYKSFSSNTKFYQWYCVAIGEEPEPGDDIELDAFFNKVYLARVEIKSSRKTKNPFSNITELLEYIDDI